MNRLAKAVVGAAIATLAVLPAAPAPGQDQAASIQARRERRNVTLESLIDAQQKCYDQAMTNVQAGQQNKPIECPVLNEMIVQTPLETLTGQPLRGIEARVPPEEVLKL